jgi:hypothetical protein
MSGNPGFTRVVYELGWRYQKALYEWEARDRGDRPPSAAPGVPGGDHRGVATIGLAFSNLNLPRAQIMLLRPVQLPRRLALTGYQDAEITPTRRFPRAIRAAGRPGDRAAGRPGDRAARPALRRNQLAGLPNQRERWSSRSC